MKNNYNVLKHSIILKYINILKELELNEKTFSNDIYRTIRTIILNNRELELKELEQKKN